MHLLSQPGSFAHSKRCHGPHGAKHAAHDVVDARTRPQRVARSTGHVCKSPHHLHDFVECGALLVRTGQEPFQADVDEPRVERLQACVVEPQLGHRARLEVLADDIGGRDQAQDGFVTLRSLQINGQALFVPVEQGEKPCA